MEPKKYGKIINIASTSAISVMGGHSPGYSASKAAVVSLTKTVALDVAGANIQVNGIAPGGIRTADFDAFMEKIGPEKRAAMFQICPLGRLGEPYEYAALAVHLASHENCCVGQVISPNGGQVI
jgi:3-oxoacyl-[acyl-carrier protein] reductase